MLKDIFSQKKIDVTHYWTNINLTQSRIKMAEDFIPKMTAKQKIYVMLMIISLAIPVGMVLYYARFLDLQEKDPTLTFLEFIMQ